MKQNTGWSGANPTYPNGFPSLREIVLTHQVERLAAAGRRAEAVRILAHWAAEDRQALIRRRFAKHTH